MYDPKIHVNIYCKWYIYNCTILKYDFLYIFILNDNTILDPLAIAHVSADHFDHSHGKSGLILAVFLPLQVGAAVLRPKKLSGDARVPRPDGTAVRHIPGSTNTCSRPLH